MKRGSLLVAPHAGAWIETSASHTPRSLGAVAPHAGAWIETVRGKVNYPSALMSRPTRARGLKQKGYAIPAPPLEVAPHAGAWIETRARRRPPARTRVAPHAGAWIETLCVRGGPAMSSKSRPT